ncbi:ABC transporter permease [Cohnella thailandensis]|uniref:Transport permease protein n=1 Tax=Cohnella thailandensis TaxID=557557 RepID=A0A841T011_9BACL|nr:ABC transporter permease [Cohnella thailandensis]MBB6635738.1 ABC transporter permease [Cohnella thailandensis]MBP1976116.1 ABC-2 type transport system permease protein [Cohnella thailandensis]
MNLSLLSEERKPAMRRPGSLTATALFAQRTLYHMRNNGFGLAIEAVVSPIVLLLIFTFLFGGAIEGSVSGYIQYLLPGILVLTVVPMSVYSGTTLCNDLAKGVYARFRTMPFWQPAAVFGSVVAEGLRYAAALLVVLTAGLALGFRPDDGIAGAALSGLYVLFFAYGASWVFAFIGTAAKRPETVSGTSMMIVYPLLFASNVLVDTSTMPGWLQAAIDANPISIAVELTRGLIHGTADALDIAAGLGVGLLPIAVFAPWTVHAYLTKGLR